MFSLSADMAVYLHRDAIDFRLGVNGLCAIVEHAMKRDPFVRACFAFTNKRRDRIRLLFWHKNGFWLCAKRLEAERFVWPKGIETVVTLSSEQLHWLLEGVDVAALRGHRPLSYAHAS